MVDRRQFLGGLAIGGLGFLGLDRVNRELGSQSNTSSKNDQKTTVADAPEDSEFDGGDAETPTPEESEESNDSTETPTPEESEVNVTSTPASEEDYQNWTEIYGEGTCDFMLMGEDGTLIGMDQADHEFYVFTSEGFTLNEEFRDLYDRLDGKRPSLDVGNDLPEAVYNEITSLNASESGYLPVNRGELASESPDAYDDLADEAEWDKLWDEASNNCSLQETYGG